MAQLLNLPGVEIPATASSPLPDQLLSLRELAALQQAPKRQPGTDVTVYATPVPAALGLKDHMFVEYDDGGHQLIARGGPTSDGLGNLVWGTLNGSDRVQAAVTPADQSRDFAAPRRVVDHRFLPNVTAGEAALPARQEADRVNQGGDFYGLWDSNSNSYAADAAQSTFGRRVGDDRTPGYWTRLRHNMAPPPAPPRLM